jgi:hypothetical protein
MDTLFRRTAQAGMLSVAQVLRKPDPVLRSLSLFARRRAFHHVLSTKLNASDISPLYSFPPL